MKMIPIILLLVYSSLSYSQIVVIPDTAFGVNGILYLEEHPQIHDDWYPRLDIDSHGNIYMVGELYLYKILSNGILDTEFDEDGYVHLFNLNKWINGTAIKVINDNEIVVGGYLRFENDKSAIFKFSQTGEMDSSFADNGMYIINDGIYVYDLVKNDNQILFSYGQNPNSRFAVKSISVKSGLLDSTFGINGSMKTDLPNYLYNHVLIETENSDFIYYSYGNHTSFFLQYDKNGNIIEHTEYQHSISDFGAFTYTKTEDGYLLGDGSFSLSLLKISTTGIIDESYGNDGIDTIDGKYWGWFCDSKKLNSEISVLAIAAFKDSLANPAFILLDPQGKLITSVGDSGIYSIMNITSNQRYEATSIAVLNDSSFVIGGYYQSANLSGNRDRYFVAKYIVKKDNTISEHNKDFNSFELLSVYPNPFNSITNLKFRFNRIGKLNITIFDLLGREITQANHSYEAGEKTIPVNINQSSAGTYFVRIMDDQNKIEYSKIILLK